MSKEMSEILISEAIEIIESLIISGDETDIKLQKAIDLLYKAMEKET